MWNREVFQEDQQFVYEELLKGEIDHVEVVSRVVETEFFRHFIGSGEIMKLAKAYPTPRKKEEVPLWIYLSTQITLRLHGAPGFSSLPYILHCGGLRDALEEGQLERKIAEDTGSSYLSFKGYNEKNSYDRRTPCDHDFVRKLARDTQPDRLESWFGSAVARYFHEASAFDDEGIFMVDGSYLFISDNPRYELSKTAYFDEHNHPISREEEKKLTPAQRKRCRFRRYYQTVALSHTNRTSDYLLYSGARVLRNGGEVTQLRPLVSDFVEAVGDGVMKTLLIDRGFIDGESLGWIKSDLGVDWIVPLKAGMDITLDAWKLAEVDTKPWLTWQPPAKAPPPDPAQRPERIRKSEKKRQETVAARKKERQKQERVAAKAELVRVELKVIPQMRLWTTCSVPVNVVLMREHLTDGTCLRWGLMTTRQVDDPLEIRRLYAVRSACEEGWRQEKCYWDLSGFRAPSFALVVSQVIFVLLAYSLLQLFLIKSDRGELAKATRQRLLAELLPDGEKVAVYRENRVGYFRVMDYSQILLELPEGPRRRLIGTIRRLRKSQLEPPELPKRPTL
jgi:hypothetical protein